MATAYTASNILPLSALPNVNGVLQSFKATVANSGSATYAPDGLAAAPIYGPGGQPLQGSEIVANGIVTLTSYVGPLLNSGALCWVLSDCTGGDLQIAAATQSQHAAQFSQLTGVIGSMRNAKMNLSAAMAKGTFTADEIIVATALGGLQYRLGNFSQEINLATTGAGGMDTGTAPVSGYVALYAIYNPTTAETSILATNATSAAAGNVYGGTNMPAGYAASALISVLPTTSAGLFAPVVQIDRHIDIAMTKVLSAGAATVPTSVPLSAVVPRNAKAYSGYLTADRANAVSAISPLGSFVGQIQVQAGNGGAQTSPFSNMSIFTEQTTYYSVVVGGTAYLYVSSYEF